MTEARQCIAKLPVAAGILPAVEGAHLAARSESLKLNFVFAFQIATRDPPGKMPGSTAGRMPAAAITIVPTAPGGTGSVGLGSSLEDRKHSVCRAALHAQRRTRNLLRCRIDLHMARAHAFEPLADDTKRQLRSIAILAQVPQIQMA